MPGPAHIALLQNAALLLAMVVIFDLLTSRLRLEGKPGWQALVGVILGGLGIGLILASFRLESGIVFDTRSVLLSMSGLFFGTIPTFVAMAMTAAFRLWQGGAAAWAGASVILATGGIGILWRRYRRGRLEDISARELYLFGVAVHLVMLALMLTLPWETARRVLAGIGLPVLVVYPLATAALGLLLANRLRRERLGAELAESEERYRSLFENNHAVMLILNPVDGAIVDANPAACRFYGWTREQLQAMRIGQINGLPPEQVQAELDRARATQRYHFRFPHRRADGSVRDVEVFSGPVAVGGRQLLYSIIHDITERTRVEAELHRAVEEASRFREALDRVPACVYMKDLRFGYLYGNRATQEVFKCSAAELMGRDDTQFFPPVTVQRLRDVDARVFRGEQTEELIEVPDEQQGARYFWEVKTPIYGDRERKTIVGLLGISTDVTAQKQAEAAVRESQQMFEAVVQHMPAHVTLIRGSDLRVILANPAYLAISPGREVIGRTLEEIWPETGREFAALCRRVLETGEPYQVEDQLNMIRRGPDGPLEPRYFSWSLHRVRLPGDQGWGLLDMSRETTAFVQAGQALQQSHAMIVKLTAQVPGVVYQYRLHPDGRSAFPFASPGMKTIYEVTPEEVREDATPVFGRLHPEDADRIIHDIQESARTLQPFHCEFRVVLPRQGLRWRLSDAMPERTEDGGTLWHGIISDITERKQAEEALRQRNEELIRFTYTVSHDLKSPLVTIQTFLGYLEKDLQAGDAVRIGSDMGYIRRAAAKMLQLLEELLELSRIGRKMNAPEDVSLQTLAREAQDLVAGQIAERRVRVAVTDLPIVLHGDRRRLLEVFQNLLDNAVKFMGDQSAPRVEIGAEETSQGIVLHVRDNGSGIDPRHQEKLFDLFEKLHPGTPGTGIGLALVKRIVEVHGGRIWAESPGPGLGSTFRFTLSGIKRITNEQQNPPC